MNFLSVFNKTSDKPLISKSKTDEISTDPVLDKYQKMSSYFSSLCMAIKAMNIEDVKYICQNYPEQINEKRKNIFNPLQLACDNGLYDIIDILLSNGADPNIENSCRESLAHITFDSKRCDIDIKNSILELLIFYGMDINKKNIYGNTILNQLCSSDGIKNKEAITYLVKHKADINMGNNHGSTPLMRLCSTNSKNNNSVEIMKLLLENKANVNGANVHQDTSLLCLCDKNQSFDECSLEMTKLLLENKADINSADSKGKTSLLWLCCMWPNNSIIDAVELLLKNKADPNLCDHNNNSALTIALGYDSSKIIGLLLTHGATNSKMIMTQHIIQQENESLQKELREIKKTVNELKQLLMNKN